MYMGDMTKMAVQNQKTYDLDTLLLSGILALCQLKLAQMMTLLGVGPRPILRQGQRSCMFYVGKTVRKSFNGRNK